jgi:RNA polymerase sigma-70 factor, ECF subfamily
VRVRGEGVGIASEAEVEVAFQGHAGQVWRAVLVMASGRREVADEATAEAFARLFRYREGVRDPVAWVFRTAFRLASAELRRERVEIGEVSNEPAAPEGAEPLLPSYLVEALSQLSPDQRLAVFLHYYADLPAREVARLCDTTPAAIRLRLHRARRVLRGLLEQNGRYA